MRSRSPQIAATGTATRRAPPRPGRSRTRRRSRRCSPRASRAAVDEAARGLGSSTVEGRRRACAARRGAAAPTCRSQCSQWNGARRSSPVDRHELQRARSCQAGAGLSPLGPTRITRATTSGWRSASRTASGPPSEWPQTAAGARVECAQRRGEAVGRRVEVKPPAGSSEWPKPGRSSAMQRAPAAQQRDRPAPVLPGAAEPVQQHERRARARLGARDHRSGQLDAQRAEAGGEPGASQPGGSRGCARW